MPLEKDIIVLKQTIKNLEAYHKTELLDFTDDIESIIDNSVADTRASIESAEAELENAKANVQCIIEALRELDNIIRRKA